MSCWTILLTLSALTSHEEILLGKRKDFTAFDNSFGLPTRSFKGKLMQISHNVTISSFSDKNIVAKVLHYNTVFFFEK